MQRPSRLVLVPALLAVASMAQAQSAGYAPDPGYPGQAAQAGYPVAAPQYDTARVVRATSVYGGYAQAPGQRCYQHPGGYANDGYNGNGGYNGNNGYPNGYNNGYPNGAYPNGTYPNGYPQGGSTAGRTVAGVVGSVLGAVVGSQVGNGSGRYIGSAVGAAVGGVAGQSVYEHSQAQRRPLPPVTVCDPVPTNSAYGNASQATGQYDVTYEYAGRTYTARLPYRPGSTIRVRVDVQPQ